jgi:molecular chaperone GrpE
MNTHTQTPTEAEKPAEIEPTVEALSAAAGEAPAQEAPFDPAARIAELEAERDEMRERWMRAEAENANIRTRAKRDVDEARQYAVQKFAADVVEAAENLRRAIASLPPATDGEPEIVTRLREGLDGIERNFNGVLERNGIKREDPTGATFDPNLHQAMAEQPSGDHPPGTVLQAWTSAWTLNGRLLKPAMVVVAKAPDLAPKLDTTA